MRKLRILLLVAIAFVATLFVASAATQEARTPHTMSPAATPVPASTNPPIGTLRAIGTPKPGPTAQPGAGSIPHPPPPPRKRIRGSARFIHSATGADIQITYGVGCGGSSYPAVVPVNCTITWKPINVSAAQGHDCFYQPVDNVPNATDGSAKCFQGNSGASHTISLNQAGTWIFGSYNRTTGNWDELAYIQAGSSVNVGTFASSAYSVAQSSFTPNGSNTVYMSATGVTTGDHFILDVSYNSLDGACVYELGGIATIYNLCDPYGGGTGVVATSGQISAAWTPPNGTPMGTYTVEVVDIDVGLRVGSRQFALVPSGAAPTVTFVPGGGNPSPAPAFTTPPSTDLGTYAYDGNDTSMSQITIKTNGTPLGGNKSYVRTFADPNGVINTNFGISTNANTDNTGKIGDVTLSFNAAQNPLNFSTNTYTYSLLGPNATGTIAYTKSFEIVGYAMQTQFLNPQGTALMVGTGTATSSLQFTNTSDTVYGSGIGDAIQFIELKTAGDGSIISLNCGAFCTTEAVTDSAGNLWTATVTTVGATYRLLLSPQGNALPANATLTLPNMTWRGPVANCGVAGCKLTTSFVPQHGLTWTDTSKNASNPVYLVDNGATALTATGSIVVVANEGHNYLPRSTQAFYNYNQPFGQTQKLSLKYTLTNVASGGSAVKSFRLTMPVGFLYSTMAVTAGGTASWISDTATCSGLASNVFCFKSGSGIGDGTGVTDSVTFSVDSPQPSFSYTDVLGQVTIPGNYPITAANSPSQKTVEVGTSNPQLVDTTALGSYSLNPALMSYSVASTGAGPYAMTFNFTNATTASDPFPDYIDAVVIQILNGAGTFSAISTNRAGFTFEAPGQINVNGGTDEYWFGTCAAQRGSGQPQAGNVTPCTATEEQSSIPPGGTIALSTTYTDTSGSTAAILWSHGANANGWTGSYLTLPISGTAAYGGFQAIGPYNTPVTLSSGTQPSIGLDSSATFGNAYVYRFNNQTGGNVYQFSIQIPGVDTGGANAADSETTPVTWTLTNAPSFAATGSSGTNYGCSINTSSSATTAGATGGILITGCTIPNGGNVDVAFAMKGPYNAGDKYTFTSQYTSRTNRPCTTTAPYGCRSATTEQWSGDQILSTTLAANLGITVNPGAIPGSTPVVVCPGCAFTAGSIDFGLIVADNATHTFSDVVRVDLTTNAATPEGWKVYESVSTNPTNVFGTPTNELQSLFDSTHSNPTGGSLTYTTASTVLPTSGNGALMVQTAGTNAQRTAFNMINSFVVNVAGGDATGPRAPTVTYLFIAN